MSMTEEKEKGGEVSLSSSTINSRKGWWVVRRRETLWASSTKRRTCFKLSSFSRYVNDTYTSVTIIWSPTCFWVSFTNDSRLFDQMMRINYHIKWKLEECKSDDIRDNKISSSFPFTFDVVMVGEGIRMMMVMDTTSETIKKRWIITLRLAFGLGIIILARVSRSIDSISPAFSSSFGVNVDAKWYRRRKMR